MIAIGMRGFALVCIGLLGWHLRALEAKVKTLTGGK